MAQVRAKVVCMGIEPMAGGEKVVRFMAVTNDSEENKTYSKYTPVLNLSMNITNPDAVDSFEEGKEYYLDFTAAE